jgi:hypothetical protein
MLQPNFYWIFAFMLSRVTLFAQKEMDIPPPLPPQKQPICIYEPSDKKPKNTFPFNMADTIKIFSYPDLAKEPNEYKC